MTRHRFRLGALAACLVILAACGGGEEDDAAVDDASSTTTTEVATTTTAPTTTAETTTSTAAPEVVLGPAWPLSGAALDEGAEVSHPAVVVKISNNDAAARAALRGLDQADVVFEERIEQEATRFAAVFHSSLPTEVGSVRSGRTSDVDIVSNLSRPVFAFSGANDGVHAQIRQADSAGLLIRVSADFGDREFSRISDFRAPNNLVVDTAALIDRADDDSVPPTQIFEYLNNATQLGTPSPGAFVSARESAEYVWSESTGGYKRSQEGQPHVTRDGERITPANVVVLTTTYVQSQIDGTSVDAITIGTGPVVVYSNGYRVEGTWRRDFPRDPYTLTTSDGQTIGLAPGQTWVSLTPAGTERELSVAEADAIG